MQKAGANAALWAYFEDLRRKGRRPSIFAAARCAQQDQMGLDGFLSLVVPKVSAGPPAAGPAFGELKEFLRVLGTQTPQASVLEVGEDYSLYATGLLSDGATVRFATRLAEFAKAISLFSDKTRFAAHAPDALVEVPACDLIIAHPPINYRPPEAKNADGFGSELVADLARCISEQGRLVWISGRRILSRQAKTIALLKEEGLKLCCAIDLPSGWCATSNLEGVALVFGRSGPDKKLIGWMREPGSGKTFAESLIRGPSKKPPPDALWTDRADLMSYRDVASQRLVESLMPKGHVPRLRLSELLLSDEWERADRPAKADGVGADFLYVPEYTASRVTIDLVEQTVAPKAVYRFAVNPEKVDAHFLARLLNSPFGRALREQVSDGTIARIYPNLLLRQVLPIPDLPTQKRIVRIHDDVNVLEAELAYRLNKLESDWRELDDISDDVASMKNAVDADQRVEDWWRDLPYPIAMIYRRYRVSDAPIARLNTILHFFEVFSVYLAAIGVSHVRTLRKDADAVLDPLYYPGKTAGIDRADFGFWIGLAQASGKELRRTLSDSSLRTEALDHCGPSLISAVESLMDLGEAAAVLNEPRLIRNKWIGHGGHIKESDAERVNETLQGVIRTLYARSAPMFRRMKLLQIGRCEVGEDVFAYEAQLLSGSDPTFAKTSVTVARRVRSKALAFWHSKQNDLVEVVPFFQIGAPANPAERTVYVYSRKESAGLHWVSYQEAAEQFMTTDKDVLRGIVRSEP